MPPESSQEKTEQATPHRLQKALEEGKVSKSVELSSALIIGFGFLVIFVLGPQVVSNSIKLMRYVFSQAPLMTMSSSSVVGFFRENLLSFFVTIGPFLALMTVIGVLVNVAQIGFRISTKPLEPDPSRMSPLKGFKRLFSTRTLVSAARDSLKVTLILTLAWWIISSDVQSFLSLAGVSTQEFARSFGIFSLLLALKMSAALLLLGFLDFAYQKYDYKKGLRMTHQEVRDESKDTDGNPVSKSRVRQVQKEMARKRMMSEVATADVVVTNPTSVAVALKYDRETMDSPIVVAKGKRLIADKIKELARAAGVPIVENKPLARSLYKLCDVGASVPEKLYKAAAEVLAYVYRLKGQEA
ncbi:MAG: flagellar biosynthesis protein FlhB [candidate division Zixibacteria bacterium]|nr:flagellar biosynthesis protein FlhB [candidate division Zixibacteria bacterium]